MVIIIGLILLALNMCACAGVIYQKKRVRARESHLQQRIRGMSDAGLMTKEEEIELNNYCIPPPPSDVKKTNFYSPQTDQQRAACSGSEGDSESEGADGMYVARSGHYYNGGSRVSSLKRGHQQQPMPECELHSRHSKSIPNFNHYGVQQQASVQQQQQQPHYGWGSPYVMTAATAMPQQRPQAPPPPPGHETMRSRSAVTINALMAQHSRDESEGSGPESDGRHQRPR